MSPPGTVHVAVGLVVNAEDEVLVSRRRPGGHLGGLWEFPGGKVEAGETAAAALRRELAEELGIDARLAFPVKKVLHRYEDRTVLLDAWRVVEHTGQASGREGQEVAWRPLGQLRPEDFPAADAPVIGALRLPPEIAITPQAADWPEARRVVQALCAARAPMILFRQRHLAHDDYMRWFERAGALCAPARTGLLFAHDGVREPPPGAAGLHVSAGRLNRIRRRPAAGLLSASCHCLSELKKAEALGADLALLSPVGATGKRGGAPGMGWERFRELARQVSMPVYALGGVRRADLAAARRHGACGIAGIRAFTAP